MSLSRGIRLLGWYLTILLLFEIGNQISFFVPGHGWEFVPGEDLDDAPKFFRSWGIFVSSASFSSVLSVLFALYEWWWCVIYLLFSIPQCPHLKKRYHVRVEKVKEYLETIKDFEKLISPQSLFLHFLGPELSTKVRRNLEVVKKSEHFIFSSFLIYLFLFLLPFRKDD